MIRVGPPDGISPSVAHLHSDSILAAQLEEKGTCACNLPQCDAMPVQG